MIPAGKVLIACLGNPGAKYVGTKHNIGFEIAAELASRWGVRASEKKFRGLFGSGNIGDRQAVILLPQTYMNLSGESVGGASQFWKIPPERVVVVHDELNIGLGELRLKIGGGHGGHNGLRSIDQHLGTRDYYRVRAGIGRPPHDDVSGWVLSPFRKADQTAVGYLIQDSADAVELLLREGLQAAQNRYHAPS